MSARLRVAIVAPSLRILGGQAVQADRLLRAWRNDADVDAWLVPVNPLPPAPLRPALGVKYLRTITTELTYVPSLVRQLARADVVHVFSASYWSYLLAPLPAMLVARALRKPVILNYRSGEAPYHLSRSAIARRTIRTVDRNIVPSSFLVDVFRDYGIRADIIPNLVDVGRFRFRERDPLRPKVLSTRNFDALYNVATTIRAFKRIQESRPDASLTLVGAGPQDVALRALAARLQLRNVHFAGRVAPDLIPQFYATHDIYLQSPDIDNMPTSIIEAFASGMPVVSTEAGGVPAIVGHGQEGLLAPLGDAEQLAAHVVRLLDEPEYAQQLARAGYATCARCTWPAVRSLWLDAYRAVHSRHARAPARQAVPSAS
ncbi:MAG TPA: glycosyltransferase family 4 protein [Vicinamibacterales bacterium]|nr:glycosyltransferase family 4 protein [Vicinamibacterales bacterium]